MSRTRRWFAVSAMLAVFVLGAYAILGLPVAASDEEETDATTDSHVKTLRFDVAEDMTRFIFNQDITFDDGLPADGSNFITRGYLYPAGTISCDDEGCTGTNADGSPQYPDKVIGEWICEGYMINDAGHATTGAWVFSTQYFDFGSTAGAQSLATQGYELADVDVAISRAISGGTGAYKTARGDSEQTLLGFNASEGVALRVELNVRR